MGRSSHKKRSIFVEKGKNVSLKKSGHAAVILDFDLEDAHLSQLGKDLVFSFEDGDSSSIKRFFDANNKPVASQLQLPGGVRVSASEVLAALAEGDQESTAAGPDEAGAGSSGINHYNDEAGKLVDGVDRLGDLDTFMWDGTTTQDTTPTTYSATRFFSVTSGGGTTEEPSPSQGQTTSPSVPSPTQPPVIPPVTPPIPVDPVEYNIRAILNTQDGGNSVTISGLNLKDHFVWANPKGAELFDVSFDPLSGSMTLTLKPGAVVDGKMYDYISFEAADGASYVAQIITVTGAGHLSSAEDTADVEATGGFLANTGLVHGEWYEANVSGTGNIVAVQGDSITTTEMVDKIIVTAESSAGSVTGMSGTTVTPGGSVDGGQDSIWLSVTANGGNATGLDGTSLLSVGDDIAVTVTSKDGDAYGLVDSQIDAESGMINVLVTGTGEAVAMTGSTITINDYWNYVELHAYSENAEDAYGLKSISGADANEIRAENGQLKIGIGAQANGTGNQASLYAEGDGVNRIIGSNDTIGSGQDIWGNMHVAGNDVIVLGGSVIAKGDGKNEVTTGAGNDVIELYGSVYSDTYGGNSFSFGDGSDFFLQHTPGSTVANSIIDMGNGEDQVYLQGDVIGSFIKAGDADQATFVNDGNDVIRIVGNVSAQSTISATGSNQTIIVGDTTGSFVGDNYQAPPNNTGTVDNSSIVTGAGADDIWVGNLVNGSSISTGDGRDRLWANTVENATIDTGDGNDIIRIAGDIIGNTTIRTGGGADIIVINGKVDATVVIDGGGQPSGRDQLILTADSYADFIDKYGAWLATDGSMIGFEKLSVTGALSAEEQDAIRDFIKTEYGFDFSYYDTDFDVNRNHGDIIDRGDFFGTENNASYTHTVGQISNGQLHLGIGDDSVTVASMDGGLLVTGDGNDAVRITGGFENHSIVNLGEGDDLLVFDSSVTGSGAIYGDLGADTILFNGGIDGAVEIYTGDNDDLISVVGGLDLHGGIIEGGSGHDVLQLVAAEGMQIDANTTSLVDLGFDVYSGQIQGMEDLWIDLSRNDFDEISVDFILDSLDAARAIAGSDAGTLLLSVNDSDNLSLLDLQKVEGGSTISRTDASGNVAVFEEYTVYSPDDEALTFFLQITSF